MLFGYKGDVRRLLAVSIALPLMTAGVVLAHWIAYLVAVPDASSRAALLAATGHAYVAWAPMTIGMMTALTVLVLLALVAGGGAPFGAIRLRPGPFLALPAIAFSVQEHAERLRVGYDSPWHVWQEPTFWRGLLLQVPFGLLAYAAARIVLRVSAAVQRLVERRRNGRPLRVARVPAPRRPAPTQLLIAPPVRAGDALTFRGPPMAAHVRL